ncbi:hypothetical protein [Geodermatophilus telluris]|uniref:hypothetical protein n=1 Tax=Geodermatophilus telluris TaxID=1190417 RepID=UPI000B8A0F8F|nr:hypothetical protein [Geodermatophilus telluris]
MIRTVVGRLEPGVRVGLDAGLRAGGWDSALTSDWTDVEAHRVHDLDEERDRVRRERFAPFCEQIARVRFEC